MSKSSDNIFIEFVVFAASTRSLTLARLQRILFLVLCHFEVNLDCYIHEWLFASISNPWVLHQCCNCRSLLGIFLQALMQKVLEILAHYL